MGAARKQDDLNGDWLGMVAASDALGISRLRIMTLALAGELEAKHIAGRTIVSRDSIDDYLARCSAE